MTFEEEVESRIVETTDSGDVGLDEFGNTIYHKLRNGVEMWEEYNSKGMVTHFLDSDGEEWWKEYNNINQITYFKNHENYEYWKEYDENGNLIHHKATTGVEKWYGYDERGRGNYYKDDIGIEWWKEFDEHGNEIHFRDADGYKKWVGYDDTGEVMKKQHTLDPSGSEVWYEFDKEDGLVYHATNNLGEFSGLFELSTIESPRTVILDKR